MADQPKAYIMDRALKTHECMVYIAAHAPMWTWEEITPANFLLKYQACETLGESLSDEEADTTGGRGVRDEKLDLLRAKMRQVVSLGKRKFRKDAAKMRLLRPLKTDSRTVAGTLREALAAESAWEEVDAAYVPEAGNTLAAFHTLREECKTEHENVTKEASEESGAGGEHRVALNELYRLCVDWYQEAFRRFADTTAHGMMIRSQIPTEAPGGGGEEEELPGAATLTAEGGIGLAQLTGTALLATLMKYFYRLVGETEWTEGVTGAPGATIPQTGLAPGNYEFMCRGSNDTGDGPESDVVTAEVT